MSVFMCVSFCLAQDPDPIYLSETKECYFAPELQALAAKLDHDPVKIYNWVCENIDYEHYFWSRKGAYATYLTKRGNEWDQCALLIALLRISGIPARYLKGPLVNTLPAVPIDQVFVEAWLDVENYRGILNGGNKAWVPLAPWNKISTRVAQYGIDLFLDGGVPPELNFDFDAYLDDFQEKGALDLFEEQVQIYVTFHYPGKSLKDIPYRKEVLKRPISILPSTIPRQYLPGAVSGPYAKVPYVEAPFIVHASVVFKAADGSVLLEREVYLPEIAGRRFCLDFIPASETDAQTIVSYGGMCFTPPGAAHLKPVLRLDGVVIEEGGAIATGENFSPVIDGKERPFKKAGTFIQIALDTLCASPSTIEKAKKELSQINASVALIDATREEYLGRTAQIMMTTYISRFYETRRRVDDLLYLYRYPIKTSSPTLLYTFPSDVKVDTESKYFIHPVWNIDSWPAIGAIKKRPQPGESDNWLEGWFAYDDPFWRFSLKLVGLDASNNEGRIFEDWQDTPGVNTVKGIMAAHEQGISVVTLTSDDIVDGHLPVLEGQTEGRIEDSAIQSVINEINEGKTVTMPVRKVHYEGMTFWVYMSIGDGIGMMFDNDHGGRSAQYVVEEDLGTDVADKYEGNETVIKAHEAPLQEGSQGEPTEIKVDDDEPERTREADGDPVDMVTGEFYHQERPDFTFKSRILSFDIIRTYKSRVMYNGPFGYGWVWNHGEHLVLNATNDDVIFYNADGVAYYLTAQSDGTYQYPAGVTFVLSKQGDEYIFMRKDQSKLYFSGQGLLIKKEDIHGNSLTFSYNGSGQLVTMKDSFNREVTFTYGANGKINKITDFLGRFCLYEYTGDDLTRFTDLEGNVYTFEYLSDQENASNNHNISKYILPNGDYLELGYYKNDTVAYHTNKKGETFNFQYSRLNRYAEIWNEEGYYRKIFYNETQDVIRITTKEKTVEQKEYDDNHNMTAYIDGNGNRTTFTYDEKRNITAKTNALGEKWQYWYDERFNKPTVIMDPMGNRTQFEYDERGDFVRKTDALGYATSYEYDQYGNLLSITDAQGGVETFQYSFGGLMFKKTDKNGNATTYGYDTIGNQDSLTDPAGNKTQVEYNAYSKKTRVLDPLEGETIYEYDSNGFLSKVRLPNGALTHNLYDTVRDLVTGAKVEQVIDSSGCVESYSYDKLGNMVSKTDKNGNTTYFRYDEMNRLIETIDPFQNAIRQWYDANGNPVKVENKRGYATSFTYDAANRKTSMTERYSGYVWQYEYDANGNLIKEIDPRGVQTRYEYNALNKKTKEVKAFGTAIAQEYRYEYDSLGKLTKAIDPLGNYIVFSYDANGNKISEAAYDSSGTQLIETSYGYDSRNLLAKRIDPNGNITQFEYDVLGRTTVEIDALGGRVEYAYDAVGNRTSVTDQKGNTTNFAYSLRNEKIREVDALSNATVFIYDDNGNLIEVQDPDGKITEYHYDALNHKVSEVTPEGEQIVTEYDENGNVVSQFNQRDVGDDYAYKYSYDYRDQLEFQQAVLKDGGKQYYVRFEYDKVGNKTEVNYPGALEVTYHYDELNRLTKVEDQNGAVLAEYTYDQLSRRTKLTYGNGTSATYAYDNLSRLVDLVNKVEGSGSLISSYAYTYDNVGNRLSETENGTVVENYAYDANNQMITWDDRDYLYDPTGNLTKTVWYNSGTQNEINELNQYTSWGGQSCGYDSRGNLISWNIYPTDEFVYDNHNRVVSARYQYPPVISYSPSKKVDYRYDGAGRVIGRHLWERKIAFYTWDWEPYDVNEYGNYIHDGHQIIAEYDQNESVVREFVYGPGIDEPVCMIAGSDIYYYHFDALGSVRHVTDDVGAVVEKYEYKPFGDTTIRSSSGSSRQESLIGNPYMFTGRRFDTGTGVYYYRNRTYSPELGRFLQRDPLGFADDVNLYRYVGNNPLTYVDPWGLSAVEKHTKFGVGLKGALILGLGIDMGVVVDTEGEWGFYGTASIGTGIQLGLPSGAANLLQQILSPLLGVGLAWDEGGIDAAEGTGDTVDAGVFLSGTWDLDDLDKKGRPDAISGISFGGGVWRSWTKVLKL